MPDSVASLARPDDWSNPKPAAALRLAARRQSTHGLRGAGIRWLHQGSRLQWPAPSLREISKATVRPVLLALPCSVAAGSPRATTRHLRARPAPERPRPAGRAGH